MKKLKKVVGLLIILIVVIGLSLYIAESIGIIKVLKSWAASIAMAGTLTLGMYLLLNDR